MFAGGDNPLPELAHVVLGLEGVPILHADYVPVTVLSFIMGGGSSFSAGGPGKGMYSRMYTNILNNYHYVQHASVLNFPYHDAGLFALQVGSNYCPILCFYFTVGPPIAVLRAEKGQGHL